MSIAPGKKDPNGWHSAHHRDLDTDLTALYKQFPVDVWVALMETWEYPKYQIPDLFTKVEQRSSRVVHYPIVDIDVPVDMPEFIGLIAHLAEDLKSGSNVLVHCKGGLGRTGLVVASILVHQRHSPKEAIEITRATRPGTIQTEAQEDWVYSYAQRAFNVAPRSFLVRN